MNAVTIKPDSLSRAHDFRSRLIEEVARVEAWAVVALTAAELQVPLLGGQKLTAVAKLAAAAKNEGLIGALNDFQRFADLRGLLCHSVVSRPGGPNFCFRPVASKGVLAWRPVMLSEMEMDGILTQVRQCANELSKAKL